jgi:hypothetical protein
MARANKYDSTTLTPQELADDELEAWRQNREFIAALLREKIADLEADQTLERLRYEGKLKLHRRIAELEVGDE